MFTSIGDVNQICLSADTLAGLGSGSIERISAADTQDIPEAYRELGVIAGYVIGLTIGGSEYHEDFT